MYVAFVYNMLILYVICHCKYKRGVCFNEYKTLQLFLIVRIYCMICHPKVKKRFFLLYRACLLCGNKYLMYRTYTVINDNKSMLLFVCVTVRQLYVQNVLTDMHYISQNKLFQIFSNHC